MFPLSIYSAKILLQVCVSCPKLSAVCSMVVAEMDYCFGIMHVQTAPEHILPLLDKSLREVSTLDGVLELKNEHFWTIAFGSYVCDLSSRC